MRNNFKIVLVFALVITIIFVSLYCLNKQENPKFELHYLDECIDDRVCVNLANEKHIGNNDKELNNGYYDFKVFNSDTGIIFVINKLWYKSFTPKLYEDEYVEKLCLYICKMVKKSTDVTFTTKDLSYLYNNILEGYLKAKDNIQWDNKFILSNIKFKSYTENYELVLSMEVI